MLEAEQSRRERGACRPCQGPNAHGKPGRCRWTTNAAESEPGRAVKGAEGDPERPGEGNQLFAEEPTWHHAELRDAREHGGNSRRVVDRQPRDCERTRTRQYLI
eukprot:2929983-Pyramimonas_sp.AAC.4